MKLLSRVILINWYLFENEEWDIHGHVALLGKNGSGKSSFIDALQLVLLGGNKVDWSPNAKASDRNFKRDIRSYALGLVKDESSIANSNQYQPREDALTRVVLVFKDDKTQICTTIGACISASRTDTSEHIEGFFILEGQELRLSDLIEGSDEKPTAKSYEHLKAFFRKNSTPNDNLVPAEQNIYLFGHEPGQFVAQMLRSLGDSQHPPAADKFRRSFKQSIKLSGLQDSVSDFVKQSILDASPINLSMMRESIESLDSKKRAVETAKKQILVLEKVDQFFNKSFDAGKRKIAYDWICAELQFITNDMQINEMVEALTLLARSYGKTKVELKKKKNELNISSKKIEQIRLTINSDNDKSKQDHLKTLKTVQIEKLERISQNIEQIKNSILFGAEVLIHDDILGDKLAKQLNEVIKIIEVNGQFWLDESDKISLLVKSMLDSIPESLSEISGRRDDLNYSAKIKKIRIEEINKTLTNLLTGQLQLHPSTEALMGVLSKHNIKSTPICQLIEVTDPEWQPAIEAYLSKNTEALFVEPENVKKAIEIYRGLRKHKEIGATVIDSKKVMSWDIRILPGTAADLIEGKNKTAVLYIQNLLSGIELLKDTDLMRAAKRALGPDGSFQSAGGFKRLHIPHFTKLGQGAIKSQKLYLGNELTKLSTELAQSNIKVNSYEKASIAITEFQFRLKNNGSLSSIVKSMPQIENEITILDKQINAIDLSHLNKLRAELEHLEDELDSMVKVKESLIDQKANSKYDFRTTNKTRHVLMALEPNLISERKNISDLQHYNAELTDKIFEKLEDEHSPESTNEYAAIIKISIDRSRNAEKARSDNEIQGRQLFSQYITNYPNSIMGMEFETIHGYAAEVSLRLKEIKDIGLHERENEVKDAFEKLIKAIRADLSIRLRGQIEKMKRRFHELNTELSNRPFSGNQIYDFRYSRIPEFKEFLDFVEQVDSETIANVDSLFDDSSYINQIIEKILGYSEGNLLEDYRNYYTFDIGIKDSDSEIHELLSRKMGSASGGEHKTPFYVAMGASLASAYRLNRRDDDEIEGGISLYLADEAFEKMDYINTIQAAEYLKSIGLQLFVAAPDDSEAKLRTFVDTVLFFIKDGNQAVINVDYVTPWAQKMITKTFGAEGVRRD